MLMEAIKNAAVVAEFHKLYYEEGREQTWLDTRWKGINVAKCPLDMWQYQEIIFETKPDMIIETGTWNGGSALFLRDMLDLVGLKESKVITIDNRPAGRLKQEDRVLQLIGDSVGKEIIMFVKSVVTPEDKVMVILDSDHSKTHVLKELDVWGPMVSLGQYLIVEDTNVFGNPVFKEHGPGPMEALQEWLPKHTGFQHDEYRERFFMTFNPKGYYKRLAY